MTAGMKFGGVVLALLLLTGMASAMDTEYVEMGAVTGVGMEMGVQPVQPGHPVKPLPPVMQPKHKPYERIKWEYHKDLQRLKSKHFGIVINEDTFDEAKEWLLASADLSIASLTSIKERIENSNVTYPEVEEILQEIDSHIADISAIREKIESTQTIEELRNAGKELKMEWISAKVSLKKTLALKWIYIMERMVERGEKVSEKVEKLIEEYKVEGKDTTELERWLEKFNEDLSRASEKLESAKERLMELENNRQINRFLVMESHALKSSVKYMKSAHHKLRNIIWMINHQKTGYVELEGTGVLKAMGEGYVEIHGDGKVMIFGNGTVTAPADKVIFAIGFGEKTEENGKARYSGEGRILIRGENITVTAEGSGLRIHAVGNGSVVLDGTGVYWAKGFKVVTSGYESVEEEGVEVEEISESA